MDELIKNINWKSTKGITLITVVGLLIFGITFMSLSEQNRNYAYIILIVAFLLIIKILAPNQTIVIGEESEVESEISQTKTDISIGKQDIQIKKKAKVKKRIEQK
ncbi:MAG: hypothetical protein JXQ67_05110 [Campylobacterales bacterium]|nr:hypothetical protein [Campylobacterales bacterium]